MWDAECETLEAGRAESRGRVLGEGAASPLHTSYGAWGSIISSPSRVRGTLNFVHLGTWKSHQNSVMWQGNLMKWPCFTCGYASAHPAYPVVPPMTKLTKSPFTRILHFSHTVNSHRSSLHQRLTTWDRATILQTLWNSMTFPCQCATLMPMLSGTHNYL